MKSVFKIVDCRWTPKVNMLKIRCLKCQGEFWHRADRWKVMCVNCNNTQNLGIVRESFLESGGFRFELDLDIDD